MRFPNLETMIMYGVYTIKDLILYSNNKLRKRNIKPLNECTECSYVFAENTCPNCSSTSLV